MPFDAAETDQFTKTGSGQTFEKLRTDRGVFFRAGDQAVEYGVGRHRIQSAVRANDSTDAGAPVSTQTRGFCARLILITIILPRQAWDKHGKS
jgi:hypothetical protein